MIREELKKVYSDFKLNFYKSIFAKLQEREGSLTATEAFSLDIIKLLDKPTIGQFARFINVPQSNATYKVASLIKKGYIKKDNSGEDKREFYLELTDKYYGYTRPEHEYLDMLMERISTRCSQEEIALLEKILKTVGTEAE